MIGNVAIQMLDLAPTYIENPFADVYVYFSSDEFKLDDPVENPNGIEGYQGCNVSNWLHSELGKLGFTVLEPSQSFIGWSFVYVNCQYRWEISAESLVQDTTGEWKLTINSCHKDSNGIGGICPTECMDFLLAIKNILENNAGIKCIDWNRAALNS